MHPSDAPGDPPEGGSGLTALPFVIAGAGLLVGILAIAVAGLWVAANRPPQDIARSGSSAPATSGPGMQTAVPATDSVGSRPEADDDRPEAEERLCPNGVFGCVTLTLPRDHADPTDGETVPVTFAIREAVVERRGALVTIPGAGSSGITEGFPNESGVLQIAESYDLVFMDPRGVGLSGRADCGASAAEYDGAWGNSDLTDAGSITAAAESFVTACLAEIGADRAEDLAYATTAQAVHDLEAFRRYLGDDHLYLYGEGRGSVIAQAYAVAYPDRVGALILDSPSDPAATIEQLALDQALGAEDALNATLGHCGDGGCSSAFDQAEATAKYDALVSGLLAADTTIDFPTPAGPEPRPFTLGDLRSTAFATIDTEFDRTLFLRAFDTANFGDPLLLSRLSSVVRSPPPDYSTAAHFAAVCGDHASTAGGPQSSERFVAFGSEAGVDQLRMGPRYYDLLPCADWPSAPTAPPNGDLATIEGRDFPVFVLSSPVDAVAPPEHARRIFERLDSNAYLVELEAGRHINFGQGYLCVNTPVSEFLLDGALPAEPRVTCPAELGSFRQASLLPRLEQYSDVLGAFHAIDTHIYLLPEFVYWRGVRPLEVGCDRGGSMTFTGAESHVRFEFEACTFIEGLEMTGEGSLDWATSGMTLVVDLPDGYLHYSRDEAGDVSIEGTLNGETIDEEWDL